MPRNKIDPSSSYPDVIGDVRFNKKYVLSMINKPSAGGCWTWNGGKHRQGYGMVSGRRVSDATRVMMTVHRLMLKIKLGRDLGANVDAVHTCGNSECVNPSHLVEGDGKMLTQL